MIALDDLLAKIPDDVVAICRRLSDLGKRGWVVGGCVRDLLRGAPAKDWDIATDALPKEVAKAFAKVIPTGLQHGTVTVLIKGVPYEVTTLRGEGDYIDGRRPKEVIFLEEITDDLARRDFTFNAIAIDPLDRKLIDPFGGRKDLEQRVLRAVGVALERFTEDGLRILRAARFAATLEARIDDETLAAMNHQAAHATLAKVSKERVHDEWLKTLRARVPSVGFSIMQRTGVLALHGPELAACAELDDALAMVDACPHDPALRLAALLSRLEVAVAETILRRLKFSNEHRERALHTIRFHHTAYRADWTDAELRRWLRKVTPARLDDVCTLARLREGDAIDDLRRRADEQLDNKVPLEPRDLAIGGRELMGELGMKPGRRVGEILSQLLQRALDDPALNRKEKLLDLARAMLVFTLLLVATTCKMRLEGSEEEVGGQFPCEESEQCPAPESACLTSWCMDGQCVFVPAPDGLLPEADQTPGDCNILYCDGEGNVTVQPAQHDLPLDDGNPCTEGICDIDAPKHVPRVAGTPCQSEGLCNGGGLCGVCLPAATRCTGAQGSDAAVQTCGDEGQWIEAAACADKPRCDGGKCLGLIDIAVGHAHGCARFEDNAVACWGATHVGQLGGSGGPGRAPWRAMDRVDVGPRHACGVRGASAWCWGAGDWGQLGNDGFVSDNDPHDADVPFAVQVAVGVAHSCALTAKGEVFCWGRNDRGQVGAPIAKSKTEVATLPAVSRAGRRTVKIIPGLRTGSLQLSGDTTCFAGARGGTSCFGARPFALPEPIELEDLDAAEKKAQDKALRERRKIAIGKPRKVALAAARHIDAGPHHTCALVRDGSVVCWGAGSPTPKPVGGISGATAIGIGEELGCALNGGGEISCWGAAGSGRGATKMELPRTAHSVHVGNAFACAVLREPRAAYCWGDNQNHQLGGFTGDRSDSPVEVRW